MQSSLICDSNVSENISNWSRTRNFAVPQSGCQTMPSGSSFASTHRFSWAQFSRNCSRCVSIIQNKTSRAPIDREPAAQASDAYVGGRDWKTAAAARPINAVPRAFPDPAGQSPAISFALDRRAGRIPSRVRKLRQFVRGTVHTGRGRFAPTQSHCVVRQEARSEMACQQKLSQVNWPGPWELREKPADLVARYRKAAPEGRALRFPPRPKELRRAQFPPQELVTQLWSLRATTT